MLEQSLGDDLTITSQAATILRALIEGIVLHPRKKRGSGKKRATMSIEVYGEPSALFLLDNDEASDGGDRMLTVIAEEVCLIARIEIKKFLRIVCNTACNKTGYPPPCPDIRAKHVLSPRPTVLAPVLKAAYCMRNFVISEMQLPSGLFS